MGARDSKPSVLSYEDAVKRVTDSELRRIREAFKRCAGGNGTALSFDSFIHDVLCDGVPTEVAEWLYSACGGTKKGISFKDLLCGIVIFTKGNIDEKIKFLWTLYVNNQNENGLYIYKWDFARTLHLENSSLPVTESPKTLEILTGLFGNSDKATYDQFRSWLLIHKDATVLSRWLLTEKAHGNQELETPTFYQSLAGVTHLEEQEIIDLEKYFWSLRAAAGSSQLDAAALLPPLASAGLGGAAGGLVRALDENRDGHVDFKELCCGLSAACRGPKTERLKFCFQIFDMDKDGVLNRKELIDMITILCQIANDAIRINAGQIPPDRAPSPELYEPEIVILKLKDKLIHMEKPVFQLGPQPEQCIDEYSESLTILENLVLTQEDFLIWSVECAEALVTPFMDLIFEVCHVVLGLKPQCKHQERDIVLGWLRRAAAAGLSVGQFWYLVGADWWAAWRGWTHGDCLHHYNHSNESSWSGQSSLNDVIRPPGPIDNSRLLAPCNEKVRSLTGEGGVIRRDIMLSEHRDFELLPASLWRAVATWYGGPHPLPRQVIRPPNSDLELELYPIELKIYRHVPGSQRPGIAPQRYLAYTAAFSRLATIKQVTEFLCSCLSLPREHTRLWLLEPSTTVAELLDNETAVLQGLGSPPLHVLLETRAKDLTWPEEIAAIRSQSVTRWCGNTTLIGATGLHNLGNTCYMNAALQAVWNTGPLTRYFTSDRHLYELNVNNPLGTKGALALRFGELCKEVWAGSSRSVAPLRVRWAVSRYTMLPPHQQHDAAELLSWLLDALHEDLNRSRLATPLPPLQTKEAAPADDQTLATAAWQSHSNRNRSIITDLFHGLLKSKVSCAKCQHESVRFDVFNALSVPLPYDDERILFAILTLLDGSVPTKYGIKVQMDATYLDVKKKLSELSGVPAECITIVEINQSRVTRVWADDCRARAAGPLLCYEIPRGENIMDDETSLPYDPEKPGVSGDSGGPRQREERSRSEILMSQSPPGFYEQNLDMKSNTLPKEMRRNENTSSPTLSVKSLNIRSSPRLTVKFGSSPSNMHQMNEPLYDSIGDNTNYVFAIHRKLIRHEVYFLPWHRWRAVLFGAPIIVPRASPDQVYSRVWAAVRRLLTVTPSNEHRNHAADCDDSLCYSFPFTLRVVDSSGMRCALCAWSRGCVGCSLDTTWSDDTGTSSSSTSSSSGSRLTLLGRQRSDSCWLPRGAVLAVDWEHTALHLRYQHNREQEVREHSSCRIPPGRGDVCVAGCVRAFTSAEKLEQFRCEHCHHCDSDKTLQIWKLPPALIIHLKRFQFVNNKWIKSQKAVDFPFENFDPTPYLASVPQETIIRHKTLQAQEAQEQDDVDDDEDEVDGKEIDEERRKSMDASRRRRLQSTSLAASPIVDDNLIDFHQHHLLPGQDPLDLKYRLYAVVSHSGQINGGHYVTYARNPSGTWLCYNDSSCRELTPVKMDPNSDPVPPIDPASAYILFYERQGLDYDKYLPDVTGKEPIVKGAEVLASEESDLKKMCVLA